MKKTALQNSIALHRIVAWIAMLFLLLPLSGCTARYELHQIEYFDVFDTRVTFSGYAKSEAEFETYASIIHDELFRLHRLFDIYHNYEGIANLKTINDNAGIESVAVDASIIDLLETGVQAYELSQGTVNIAMGAVLSLWHDQREAGRNASATRLPSDTALQEAARHTSLDDLQIDSEKKLVFLRDKEMSLDVGAIAKGFAAQSAIDRAKEAGLSAGILDAGGNVCVVGTPFDGRAHWRIGVQNPKLSSADAQNIFDVLTIDGDASVVTSGSYQRYYTVAGHAYHHIIDPHTLYPAEQVEGVTIIHPSSIMGEILSTAAFILPYESACALVESQHAQAIWIYADGSAKTTANYPGQLQ